MLEDFLSFMIESNCLILKWYKKLPEVDRVVPSELVECLPQDHWIVIEIKKIETLTADYRHYYASEH